MATTTIQPHLKWYTKISSERNVSPRCPLASVHRCPRYYQSIALLGFVGVTTSMEPEEDHRVLENWRRSDLWPASNERAAQVIGPEGKPLHFLNFCPEVSFDDFGWFASNRSYHAGEIDADVAHLDLAAEGATAHEWRWIWV